MHFHCLCYAHFEEFHWNPALKITISLAQRFLINYKVNIFSDQCSLYPGIPDSCWSWAPGRWRRSRKLRRPSLQSWSSLLDEWLPILCRGHHILYQEKVFHCICLVLHRVWVLSLQSWLGKKNLLQRLQRGQQWYFPASRCHRFRATRAWTRERKCRWWTSR